MVAIEVTVTVSCFRFLGILLSSLMLDFLLSPSRLRSVVVWKWSDDSDMMVWLVTSWDKIGAGFVRNN